MFRRWWKTVCIPTQIFLRSSEGSRTTTHRNTNHIWHTDNWNRELKKENNRGCTKQKPQQKLNDRLKLGKHVVWKEKTVDKNTGMQQGNTRVADIRLEACERGYILSSCIMPWCWNHVHLSRHFISLSKSKGCKREKAPQCKLKRKVKANPNERVCHRYSYCIYICSQN